ncbi:MAG: glycosyltransferase family 4 protein, partial [bacterium]
MNIWIFNHYAITPNYPGGTRHFDFSKELIKKGHKVTIFASSFHYMLLEETKKYERNFFIEEDYEGVKFVWIKTPGYKKSDWRRVINMLVYSFRAYFAAKVLGKKEKPDVIIGSSVHLFAPLVAYFLSKFYKTPFILEIRDLWPKVLIDLGISKYHPFIILLAWIEKFLYKRAHKIVSLVDRISEYLAQYGISENKISLIPNGISLGRLNKSFNLEKSKKDENEIIVCYAGILGKANDPNSIAKLISILVKKIKNVKVWVIGKGYDYDEVIKSLLDVKDSVIFWGAIPKDEVYNKLFLCDIFILRMADTSYYGSFNKLFDYLAVGKPIVFWVNIPNNVVERIGAGVTVKEDDPYKVVEAVEKIISLSEEERNQMGQRGRKYVLENHNVEKLAEKL